MRWRITAGGRNHGRLERTDKGWVDEVVVGNWLHLEQMHTESFWLRVGDVHIHVDTRGRGKNAVCVVVTKNASEN